MPAAQTAQPYSADPGIWNQQNIGKGEKKITEANVCVQVEERFVDAR
jgi:hypothetical protein